MPHRRLVFLLVVLPVCLAVLGAGAENPVPGQNINMVSGTQYPGGDPYLQRQDEVSMGISTRNSLHLLGGANDYRSVDVPYPDVSGDSAEEATCVDASGNPTKCAEPWLGVFKSFDGGQRWQSVLLPGYPQDTSPEGLASPLKGFSTAADPVVRAGTNGMFYYAGMAFNRNVGTGVIFVARMMDLNNKENGDATQAQDPIRYINTVPIAYGTATSFLDKPWMAVDIPRPGTGTCNLQVPQPGGSVPQSFAAGNVYVVYTKFANTAATASQLMFTRSGDCGATWSTPIAINGNYVLNQGATIQIDPQTGIVYVAWRVFRSATQADAIVGVASLDGGRHFTPPIRVVTLPRYNAANPTAASFFDQGTTGTSFRTNAYPALAVDDSTIPFLPGRIYLAWSQRGAGPNGDARIMMMVLPSPSMFTSSGIQLPVPFAIDNNAVTDDLGTILNPFGNQSRGHQFQPQITAAGGKIMVAYYDVRLDHTLGVLSPLFTDRFVPDASGKFYRETRTPVNEAGTLFTPFADDFGLVNQRHTIEVRLAQSKPSFVPSFTTARVTSYNWGTLGDGSSTLHQLQVNPPNLPLFRQGTAPFIGDYLDMIGNMFTSVRTSSGGTLWKFNGSSPSPLHYVGWTSNQDVRPPTPGHTWAEYTPPASGVGTGGGQSVYDPSAQRPACTTGTEGTRNQNVYSSRITQGLLVSSPQNSKPLSPTLQRAFVVLVQNFTTLDKSFRLTIANQPTEGKASFLQFPSPPQPDPLTTLDVKVAARSGVVRTVFTTSARDPNAVITINVVELNALQGSVKAGGLTSFVVLNADSNNPPLINPDGSGVPPVATVEIYTPNVSNPNVSNPNVSNPNVSNPNVSNPNVSNPNVSNPNVSNLEIADPNISNPNVSNPNVSNPNVSNPNVSNPNVSNQPVTDATYATSNEGNTTAAYNIKLVGASPVPLQLILSKSYATPAAQNCHLFEQSHMILQANITSQNTVITPNVANNPVDNITNPNISNATLSLGPGESALITIRGQNVYCRAPGCQPAPAGAVFMEDIVSTVTPAVAAQAANTNDETHTPKVATPLVIITASLPDGAVGTPYAANLQATGGQPPYSWGLSEGSDGLPAGLFLNQATGAITGTPTQSGTLHLLVDVQDSSTPPRTAQRSITVIVQAPETTRFLTFQRQPTTAHGGQSLAKSIIVNARDASGAALPGIDVSLSLANAVCASAQLSGTLTRTTDDGGSAQFPGLSIDRGGFGYTLRASAPSAGSITSDAFDIYGFCAGPSMTTSRFGPTVTTMSNGETLVAGGGNGDGSGRQTAERYLPATNVFLAIEGSMTTPRFNFHAATALQDGEVFISGGRAGPAIESLDSAEIYNPSNGSFGLAGHMNSPRESHTVTTLPTGIVLIAGGIVVLGGGATGFKTPSAELYDPFKGTFGHPVGPMAVARANHTATPIANGLVLLAGGNLDNAVAEIFDTETLTFRTTGSMNIVRQGATATKLANGKVLIAGGKTIQFESQVTSASAEIFDPATETFTATGSMNFPRAFHSTTLLPSGQVLIAGGESLTETGSVDTRIDAELYDPTNGTFVRTGDLIDQRSQHSAIVRPDGKALIIGGPAATEVYYPPSLIVVNEANAFASIRQISAAQVQYFSSFAEYAFRLVQLGPAGANFLSGTLGCATQTCTQSGYAFTLDGPVDSPRLQYFLKAIPQSQGTSGVRSFCGTETGTFVKADGGDIATRDACLALPPL